MSGPVESKVKAASSWAAISGAVVWALETYVFHGLIPDPILALVGIAVPGIVAYIAGYAANHTARPDLEARP